MSSSDKESSSANSSASFSSPTPLTSLAASIGANAATVGDSDSQKWLAYATDNPWPVSLGYWLEAHELPDGNREVAGASLVLREQAFHGHGIQEAALARPEAEEEVARVVG